jgi:flagellum-specific peptidoglycan hydrolase FlgJ
LPGISGKNEIIEAENANGGGLSAPAVFLLGGEMTELQGEFLRTAFLAAAAAQHLFPEHAACEAALESSWGMSRLAREACNLFGQKQAHPPLPGTGTISMLTREFIRGEWTSVDAEWVKFRSLQACFEGRMQLLRRLSSAYSHYASALQAKSGEEFVTEVSKSWSTDPARAKKVLAIYDQHRYIFAQAA